MEEIVDALSPGLLCVDPSGTILLANRSLCAILEHPLSELMGVDYTMALENTPFVALIKESFAKQKPSSGGGIYKRPSGGVFQVEWKIAPLAKKRLLLSLELSDTEKGVQKGEEVTHQIRNYLTGIKGFASILARRLTDRPNELPIVHYIAEGASKIDGIISKKVPFSFSNRFRLHENRLEKAVDWNQDWNRGGIGGGEGPSEE